MIKDILCQFIGKTNMVEVYTNQEDTSKFHIGKILACNDEYNVMSIVTPQGSYDGLLLEKLDQIINVQYDTKYDKKIISLIQYHKTELPFIHLDQSDLIGSLLEYARSSGSIVSITVLDSGNVDGQGFVDDIENGICKIRQVDDDGMNNGYGFLKLEDITKIALDGEDEVMLQILNGELFK